MQLNDTTVPAPPPEPDDGTIDVFLLEAGFRERVLRRGGERSASAETDRILVMSRAASAAVAMRMVGSGLVLDTWASALPERPSRWRRGIRRHKFDSHVVWRSGRFAPLADAAQALEEWPC